MVPYSQVLAHNANLKHATPGLVGVFVGATSGIGLATLRTLVTQLARPRIYVVGRSRTKFAAELAQLRLDNPQAEITFVESEIALLRNVDHVCLHISRQESRLDLLFLSAGFLAFGGPHHTEEGLDTCFALSLYTRMRFVQRLLPLLHAAPKPRVLSVLAGGHERPLYLEDGDLGLRACQGRAYTAARAVDQATTLHTLAFAHLASQHPHIAFLHAYPGWVATGFLSNLIGTLGRSGQVLAWAVEPLWRIIAISVQESGQWQAFHATSERYPSREMIQNGRFDVENVAQSHAAHSGMYLVLADGQTGTARDVLGPLEEMGWPEKVWTFLDQIFEEVIGT